MEKSFREGVVVIIYHHWRDERRALAALLSLVFLGGAGDLGGGELGHSLGALGDGVLGELTGEDEAHGGLISREVTVGLVVAGELGSSVAIFSKMR